MIRNRVSWGFGLLTLLLSLGLAACGGDEPAPVVQPPAPPPAPPPFQPQAVEVALGDHGGKVTLMTTEDGGFTLMGEKFESGGSVTAENGNMYILELADGQWTAKFDAHETMVTLGITEEMITIVKAEDGSYWLGDMEVISGETMATAPNGNMYTLTMMTDDEGNVTWMATYVEPVFNVMLGSSGESRMIKKSEDGSYWLGDVTVETGATVTTANGNMYTLMMGEDGMWSATYMEVHAHVMLGASGVEIDIIRAEDGSYWVGDMEFESGDTVMAGDNSYVVTMGEDGMWTATYQPAMGSVMVGGLGYTVPAMRDEAGNWSAVNPLTGETIMLTEGGMFSIVVPTTGYTNTYELSSDGSGMWTATYQKVMVSVMLGTSGTSKTLVRAEDGSYWLDDMAVESGMTTTMADNGNNYTLTMADGEWMAMFAPEMMEIMGTGGLMASSREDDDMYDVSDSSDMLPASGMGDITTSSGAMYHVHMDDGMLMGVRYDGAPKGDTVHITVGLMDSDLTPDTNVTYNVDDRSTAMNEANTKITVAGESISLGDLLGDGMASKAAAAADGAAGEFVKSAVETLMDLLTEAELYAKYQAAADDEAGRSAFDARLNNIADRAQAAIVTIFGSGSVNIIDDGTLPEEDTGTDADQTVRTLSDTDYIRASQTVRGLNRLLDALSSADAFVDATKDGNNGVFEKALDEDPARKAFSANKSEYMVYLGTTANTRYGAIALKVRVSGDPDLDADGAFSADNGDAEAAAVHGMRFAFDGADADTDVTGNRENVGKVGAFSYANLNDTLRSRNLPQTGGAVYMGGTIAVTPGGTLYNGDMRIDVNFRSQSVFGRVSELRDKDNNLWKYLDSEVTTIYLPRQNYNNLTQFGGVYDTDTTTDGVQSGEDDKRTGMGDFLTATIVYAESQGFSTTPTEQPGNARFAGRFIGEDGAEITGTWSLGQPVGDATTKSNDLDVIYGSYGVTRMDAAGPVGPADGTAGGAAKTTVVLPATDATATPATLGATFAGDTDVAGILRLGKRSTGGGKDVNNDFDLQTIFASPGDDPKKTVNNSPTHVQVVVEHIMAQRAIYVIYAEQVGGDSADEDDLANRGRQSAWKSINDFVRDHIFDLPVQTGDTEVAGSLESITDTTQRDLSSPLGSFMYPKTRNNKPDDDAALDRIDALLAAFDDKYAFEAALKDDSGGVFDSQPALDKGATQDPFPLDTVDDVTDTGYSAEPAADIFGRLSSQTQLFSLSTDYTRFGVWFRRETDSAVADWMNHASPDDGEDTPADTGSTSPGSYAYSWLAQSTYRTDRPVATYPSSGLATYEGKTLIHASNTHVYIGDALVRVNWMPLDRTGTTPAATSTIVPIFSNIRKWQDSSLDRLMHDSKIVDEIVLRASGGGDLVLTDDGGKLMLSATDAAATVTYTDGTRIDTAIAASTISAKFVGSSSDGPLGILGSFMVPGAADGFANSNTALFGSFGADLTSFETLLP